MNESLPLYQRLQAGDHEQVFKELHATQATGLYWALKGKGYVSDRPAFFSIFNDALLALPARAHQFDSDSFLIKTLIRITTNKAISVYRQTKSEQGQLLVNTDFTDNEETLAAAAEEEAISDQRETALRQLRRQLLYDSIKRLQGRKKEVIERLVYQEMSLQQIATDLGLAIQTICTIRNRAFEELKEHIHPQITRDNYQDLFKLLLLFWILSFLFQKKVDAFCSSILHRCDYSSNHIP